MQNKNIYKKIFAFVIIVAVVLPIFTVPIAPKHSTPFTPQKAHAQFGDLIEGAGVGAGACALTSFIVDQLNITIAEVPVEDGDQKYKELLLDCLTYNLGNALIEQMTDNIVEWIQSGFDGNPAFVTDLDRLYRDLGDTIAGDFIDSHLGFLCSPFRPQIELALIRIQQDDPRRQYACTLTDVVENADEFLSGDFTQGGWEGWFRLTQQPQNNPYGALIQADNDLNLAIAAATQNKQEQLSFGRGFLSKEVQDCYEVPNDETSEDERIPLPNGVGPPRPGYHIVCDPPRTVTPGSVVEDQLNDTLGSGRRRLEVADEMNEIINALIAFLVQDVLLGDGGLAGYDSSDFSHEFPDLELPPNLPGFPGGPDGGGGGEPIPGAPVNLTRDGVFLAAERVNPYVEFRFPATAGKSFNSITIDFDLAVADFPGERFNGALVNLEDPGAQQYLTVWVNVFEEESRGKRTILDLGGARAAAERAPWEEQTDYHITLSYDAVGNSVTLDVANEDTGEAFDTIAVEAPTDDIRDTDGSGLLLSFGLKQPLEDGAFMPPFGWTFSNLSARLDGDGFGTGGTGDGGPTGEGNGPPNKTDPDPSGPIDPGGNDPF